MRSGADPIEWFFERVVAGPNGCHLWVGRKNDDGYGLLRVSEKPERSRVAHAWLYEELRGEIPAGTELDHKCTTRNCVNLDHLEPVPHEENCRRGRVAKLNFEIAAEIRSRHAAGESQASLAREFGVKPPAINKIVLGKRWSVTVSDE